jgi:hypothetical protein
MKIMIVGMAKKRACKWKRNGFLTELIRRK